MQDKLFDVAPQETPHNCDYCGTDTNVTERLPRQELQDRWFLCPACHDLTDQLHALYSRKMILIDQAIELGKGHPAIPAIYAELRAVTAEESALDQRRQTLLGNRPQRIRRRRA